MLIIVTSTPSWAKKPFSWATRTGPYPAQMAFFKNIKKVRWKGWLGEG